MELRHLQEFIAIIERGSLGDAARTLRVSQPTLTRNLKQLEQAAGGALFFRTKQGMSLTPLGFALEPRARTIVSEIGRTRRELGEMAEGQAGHVIIGTALGIAQAILPQALRRFRATHPHVRVTVIEGLFPDVLPGLKSGDIDYAFFSTRAMGDKELTGETLLPDEPVIIVTRADNPIAARRRPTLEDIQRQTWILPTKPDHVRSTFESIFAKAALATPEITLEFNSYFFAKRLLQEDNFLSIFTRLLVQEDIDRKIFKVLNVPNTAWTVTYHAIFRRGPRRSLAAEALLDEIRKSAGEYCRRRK